VLFFPPSENFVLLELDLFEKKLIAKGIIKLSDRKEDYLMRTISQVSSWSREIIK
jgi:hypothetical protein